MNNKSGCLVVLILIIVFFCFFTFPRNDEIKIVSNEYNYNSNQTYDNFATSNSEVPTTIDNTNHENALSENNFYYNQLNDTQKNIYRTIKEGCSNYMANIKLNSPTSRDDLATSAYAVQMDHPEFYWTRKYTYEYYDDNNVSMIYYEIPSDARSKVGLVNSKVESIFEEMKLENINDDYEKLRFFYEWIINHTDYGSTSNSQDITSIFIDHTSVCAGYSKAFLYLCQKANIECAYVAGSTDRNENHAWNIVKLGNNYYWVDTTWGDPVFAGEKNNKINYTYFLVDDGEFFENHVISKSLDFNSSFNYPGCLDDSLNYYKSNGSYFDTYNVNTISNYFRNKFRANIYNDIELKFKHDYDFEQFINEFLKKQNARIFDDIKAINPGFYGSMQISYDIISSANYISVSVELT